MSRKQHIFRKRLHGFKREMLGAQINDALFFCLKSSEDNSTGQVLILGRPISNFTFHFAL